VGWVRTFKLAIFGSFAVFIGLMLGAIIRMPEPSEVFQYSGKPFVCHFDQHQRTADALAPFLNNAKFAKDRTADFESIVTGDGKVAIWVRLYRHSGIVHDGKCHAR
jgi:hypothetical protein